MFRLVTQGCEKPSFLLVCDNIECAFTTSAEASMSELNPITVVQQETAFLEQCKKAGWLISLRLCLCPGHSRQVHETMAKRRASLVGGNGGASFSAE